MDAIYVDDDDTYDDLDDYSRGSFMYEGEIYMRLGASDKEISRGLQSLYDNHPDVDVRMKAVYTSIVMLMKKIHKKHC